MTNASERTRLQVLDMARFLAALMVVAFHWTFNGFVNGKVAASADLGAVTEITRYGYWGVTFFFIISGFVISYSVRGRSTRQYVTSRLARLFPAFWIAVILSGTVLMIVKNVDMPVTFPQMLANLTMFPSVFDVPFVDGVYWTLEFELVFYLVVLGVLLFLGARFNERIMLVWLALMAGAMLAERFGEGTWWSTPAILDRPFPAFAVGAVIAGVVFDRGTWIRWGAITVGTFIIIVDEVGYSAQLAHLSGQPYRRWVVAGLMVGFVGVILLQALPFVRRLNIPGSRALGDLTYPLYLVHAHLGYLALNRWLTTDNALVVYPLLLIAMLVISELIHVFVEAKPRRFWQSLFDSTAGVGVERLDAWIARCSYRGRTRGSADD